MRETTDTATLTYSLYAEDAASAVADSLFGFVYWDSDYYRNGEFADHPAEASAFDFLSSTGMVIIANNDDDNGDEEADFLAEPSGSPYAGKFRVNGAGDLAKMHRLRISPLAIPSSLIPTNWMVRVDFEAVDEFQLNNGLHFFWNMAADAQGYPSFGLSNQTLRNTLGGFADPREIGVEGRTYGSEYTVTLKLLEGETDIASDTVRILVAPFIALPQTAVTKFVYTGIDNQWANLNQTVHPALTGLVPWRSIGSMNFVQDFAELGVTALSTNHLNSAQDVILHFKMGHFNSEISPTNAFYSIGGTDGGNVETLPPTPGHPLGQIVIGTKDMAANLRTFLQRQKVQTKADGTLVELDTSWLNVGHVDELFSIVPTANGYRLLVADLQSAIDCLLANPTAQIERFQDRSGGPTTTDEVYWKYMHESHESAVQSIHLALGQIRQTLATALDIPDSEIIRIPVFFSVEGSSYPYTPNSINLLSVLMDSGTKKLLVPDPFFAPMRSMIESRLAQAGYASSQIVWIDSFDSDTYWGNVHCITNSRRKP